MTGVRVGVENLDVNVGGVPILRGLDLEFEPGRVSVLTGPSGSGKTTLLTAIAGLQPPASGRIRFVDPTGRDVPDARVGLVHQAFALLSLLTAAENVELAAQLSGRRRAEVIARAEQCLGLVGLAGRGRHLVQELSGGEQQRVAVARALITEPQVLLADEPTAQLDAASRGVVLDLLRRLADDGVTVVVATHDPDVAAWGDRTLHLRSGRLVPPDADADRDIVDVDVAAESQFMPPVPPSERSIPPAIVPPSSETGAPGGRHRRG